MHLKLVRMGNCIQKSYIKFKPSVEKKDFIRFLLRDGELE